nr:uncharacterized protein LOC105342915 [Crassostrea gigas]
MDKISNWLIILFLKEYNASWAILCPSVRSWETRSWLYCKENPLWYHCLNDLEGEIIEICLKPTYIAKGYYPVLSKEHSFILSTECPRTLYQPFGQMSNEFRKRTCAYTKSLCNGLGEETCKEGSSREDRSCRCRHTDGYVSIESLQTLTNKSCYRPKYETNGCSYFTCPEDEELNPWYACVKKCPFGYHRRKYESSCVANTSSEFLSSETEVYGSTGRILHTSSATQKIHVSKSNIHMMTSI